MMHEEEKDKTMNQEGGYKRENFEKGKQDVFEVRDYQIQRTLSRKLLQKLGRQILYFVLLTALLAWGVYIQLRQRVWYADNPWYDLLHQLNHNPWICATLFLLWVILGMAVIGCRMIYRLIGYVDDITEGVNDIYQDSYSRVVMPEELHPVEEQLNEIRENARKSRQALREAEQRKSDLIVYLAHDLKTPLTSVIGYLSLLNEEQEISSELRRKYQGIALEKAERLEELINEFFEITRFNLSEIPLEISQVNAAMMLEQIAFEFRPVFAEKGITYRLELDKNIMLSVDVDKMQRVFDNLLKNAYYYSYDHSEIFIRLGCFGEWKPIGEEKEISGTWDCFISFENRGKTIPRARREQIFEQFFRMESARSSRSGGAGLGLAIAREIVRKHGGEIICESRDERIVFTVFL